MTGKTKVLLFAMDACDPDLARSLAAAGQLPNLARVLAASTSATSRNPYGLYVGSLWSSFFTARTAARTGFHCWEEVDSKSYERRLTTPLDIRGTPFWETLSAAGKRVAILDVPHSRAAKPIDGVMVCEYACHDRHFGFHTWPAELARYIESRIGLHPILTADPYDVREWSPDDYVLRAGDLRTTDEDRALHAGLLAGVELKSQLSAELLAQGGWDLFLTVFGESHSIGHQQWHLHDPSHPRHDPALAAELGDPLVNVYRRIDAALGEHLDLAGPDAAVFVLLSHGFGPHYDGTHLLHEILRLLQPDRDPASIRDLTLPVTARDWTTPEERASQRFFLSPNNTVFGGVRINLIGREPHGRVHPGAEYDAVCAQLAEDLHALINVDTGRPIVRSVEHTDDHYDREADDLLPDLLIDWSHEALVETVWSPKTGVVHGPYTHWRTGDHRPDGLLLASGPGFTPGVVQPAVNVVDLGASVSARFGVELTDDVDGRAVPWIAGAPTEALSA